MPVVELVLVMKLIPVAKLIPIAELVPVVEWVSMAALELEAVKLLVTKVHLGPL